VCKMVKGDDAKQNSHTKVKQGWNTLQKKNSHVIVQSTGNTQCLKQ